MLNLSCFNHQEWILFPLSYIMLYSLAILLSCTAFIIASFTGRATTSFGRKVDGVFICIRHLKKLAKTVRSGDNAPSQIVISAVFVCNIVYMALAMSRTYHSGTRCFASITEHFDLLAELTITPLLILFFIIRLLASDNIFRFWIKLHTFVDIVTLPNIFIVIYLGKDLLVTKTLRFIWLTQFIEVLHFVPVIRSKSVIEALGIVVHLLALWLGATGFIHMLETMGDPWKNFSNSQNTTYLEYAYFIIVTLSTVGYGDLTAATDIGRAFMTCFIIGGIAFFVNALPNLLDMVRDYYQRTQWKHFDTTRIQRHVLVCGSLSATTVAEFLSEFLHKDRGDHKTHVLLMHTDRPDTKLRTVLRQYYSRVQYMMGSVLNINDLSKAKMDDCWEVFILASKGCKSPEREDQENLLCLVSIKSIATKIPVTIQVLLSSSKEKVTYIPHTEMVTVICFSEFKLGLLAQSCICPRMSTLVSNLLYAIGPIRGMVGWKHLYGEGISQEIYISRFSSAFEGMSFQAAAKVCYESLKLILLAVEDKALKQLYISPSPTAHPNLVVRASSTMFGYFIGENQIDVDKVSTYTGEQGDVERGGRFPYVLESRRERMFSVSRKVSTRESTELTQLYTLTTANDGNLHLKDTPQSMEECCYHASSDHDHVLVCIIADDTSPALNLSNFLKPLHQYNNILTPEHQLRPVTIVANKAYLEKEWEFISRFPGVSVCIGSPLDWNMLSKAGVDKCCVCVILTAFKSEGEAAQSRDKGVILCWLMIHSHFKTRDSNTPPPFIIADLNDASNIQFLKLNNTRQQQQRWQNNPYGHTYLTQPFACGEVLASSFFDSITSSSFHSPGIIFLVQQIITGEISYQCPTRSFIHSSGLRNVYPSVQTFKQLYIRMLEEHKTVIAISRLMPQNRFSYQRYSQRYVVTAPPPETILQESDQILILYEHTIPP